jgi:PelA/Pel-15E family pectate lyase
VEDPNAPTLWARFYDLETGQPFFCNRDGEKVYRLADVELERRSGYAWYGAWATQLLEKDYPALRRER